MWVIKGRENIRVKGLEGMASTVYEGLRIFL